MNKKKGRSIGVKKKMFQESVREDNNMEERYDNKISRWIDK